ncbi:MAG: ExbD/TolR family protein [Phycisphaerae bacterium]
MKLRATRKEETVGVNMAPLIDCVFILLIFFLVTSMLQKPHHELLLDVPEAGAADTVTEQHEPLVIELRANHPDPDASDVDPSRTDPYIVIDGEPMTRDLLERRLRQVAQESPNRRIRIDAEPQFRMRHVVPVADLCRLHGLIRIDVRPM